MIISFKDLQAVCRHAGLVRNGEPWCGWQNKTLAKQWSDWKPCTKENCPLNQKQEKPEQYKQFVFDFIQEEPQ